MISLLTMQAQMFLFYDNTLMLHLEIVQDMPFLKMKKGTTVGVEGCLILFFLARVSSKIQKGLFLCVMFSYFEELRFCLSKFELFVNFSLEEIRALDLPSSTQFLLYTFMIDSLAKIVTPLQSLSKEQEIWANFLIHASSQASFHIRVAMGLDHVMKSS